MTEQKTIQIELTEQELNILFSALTEAPLPLKFTFPLLQKLQTVKEQQLKQSSHDSSQT
jgi:hypothetical protein